MNVPIVGRPDQCVASACTAALVHAGRLDREGAEAFADELHREAAARTFAIDNDVSFPDLVVTCAILEERGLITGGVMAGAVDGVFELLNAGPVVCELAWPAGMRCPDHDGVVTPSGRSPRRDGREMFHCVVLVAHHDRVDLPSGRTLRNVVQLRDSDGQPDKFLSARSLRKLLERYVELHRDARPPVRAVMLRTEPYARTFATGDVTVSGTAGALTATVIDSGDHIHYTVEVTGMTNPGGTVIATIAAGVCTATVGGLPNVASTSTDNTVLWGLLYTDDFNRANGGLGANWTFTGATMAIGGNQVSGLGSPAFAYWINPLPADQFAQWKAVSTNCGATLQARTDRAASLTGYEAIYGTASGGQIVFRKHVAGTATVIATVNGVGTLASGTVVRFEVQGTALRVKWNGSTVASTTDASISAGSYAGFRSDDSTQTIDDWACGSL